VVRLRLVLNCLYYGRRQQLIHVSDVGAYVLPVVKGQFQKKSREDDNGKEERGKEGRQEEGCQERETEEGGQKETACQEGRRSGEKEGEAGESRRAEEGRLPAQTQVAATGSRQTTRTDSRSRGASGAGHDATASSGTGKPAIHSRFWNDSAAQPAMVKRGSSSRR
jgi:hypothetical protein